MRFSIVPIDPDTFTILDTTEIETAEIVEAGTTTTITDVYASEGVAIYFTLSDSIAKMVDVYMNGSKQLSNYPVIGPDAISNLAEISSASTVENDVAVFDSNGDIKDSGVLYSSLATNTNLDKKTNNLAQRSEITSVDDTNSIFVDELYYISPSNFKSDKSDIITGRTHNSNPSGYNFYLSDDYYCSYSELSSAIQNDINEGEAGLGQVWLNSNHINDSDYGAQYLEALMDTDYFTTYEDSSSNLYYMTLKNMTPTKYSYLTGINQDLTTTSSVNFGYLEIDQQADAQGLQINGYDDVSSDNLRMFVNSDGGGRLKTTGYFLFDSGNVIVFDSGSGQSQFRDSSGNITFRVWHQPGIIEVSGYINNDGTASEGLSFDASNNAMFTEDLDVQGNFTVGGAGLESTRNTVRRNWYFDRGQGNWNVESGSPTFAAYRVELTLGDSISHTAQPPFISNENGAFHSRVRLDFVTWDGNEDQQSNIYMVITPSVSSNTYGFKLEVEEKTATADVYEYYVRVYGYVKHSGTVEKVLVHAYQGSSETSGFIGTNVDCSIQKYDDKIVFNFAGNSAEYTGTMPGWDSGFGFVSVENVSGSMPTGFHVYYWDRLAIQ